MTAAAIRTDGLDGFNALPDEAAREALHACCASTTWVSRVLAGRPYATSEQLLDTAEGTCRALGEADVDEALAGHPRIGDRARGRSAEAEWSRQEQSSVSGADEATRDALHAGNVAYEQRFGRVFLIRAAGRSPQQMLAELQRRLDNDPDTERREVTEQLAEITRLRVERLVAS